MRAEKNLVALDLFFTRSSGHERLAPAISNALFLLGVALAAGLCCMSHWELPTSARPPCSSVDGIQRP